MPDPIFIYSNKTHMGIILNYMKLYIYVLCFGPNNQNHKNNIFIV